MKFHHFGRRSAALGSFAVSAACALAVSSGGCQIQLSDGIDSGSGGKHSATVAENGGAKATAGSAPIGNGGARNDGQSAAGNTATEGGSGDAGQSGSSGPTSTNREDCGDPDHIPND